MTDIESINNVFRKYIKNEKSIEVIEKNIRKITTDVDEYRQIAYDVLVMIREKELSLAEILGKIKEKKVGIDNDRFSSLYQELKEKDNFMDNPFTVEEGVLECNKCGSKRTLSYSKQVRRSDEGFTTFCMCSSCGARWRIN
jgi:DNA-directed RNA polymerase subunit M/transcription elongation factor TFIIS